jgi:hypothetical protein
MAKRTLAQKKKSDVRQVLQPTASHTESSLSAGSEVTISGMSLDVKKTSDEKELATSNYLHLKNDLLKVGVLALGAIAVELAGSYIVISGVLSYWGIS